MNYISWLFPPNQQSLIRDYRLNEQHWNWIESKSTRSVSWLKWSLINPKMQNAERQRILHNGWRSHFRRALITIAVVHCSNFFSPFNSMDFEIQFNWTDKAQAPTNWEWLRTTSSQNVWGWWMDSYVLTRFFCLFYRWMTHELGAARVNLPARDEIKRDLHYEVCM